MDTELYVVKGKVYQQKKGYSAEVGEDVGFEKGAKMVKTYHDQNPDDILAHFVGRNIIEAILAQPGVVGFRTFYSLNELGFCQLFFVGVDTQGKNILNINTVGHDGSMNPQKGIVASGIRSCPPYCGGSTNTETDSTNWW